MTCIVGIVENGTVYMGGDSAGVGGHYDLVVRADRKVFTKDGFVFGFTSSFRMGQLLRYALVIPKRHPDKDLFEFLVTEFMDAVRNCLKNGGYATKDKEEERGGIFLLGHTGRLFRIDSDYQVGEAVQPYEAVGCGEGFATGALFATPRMAASDRVLLALQAAQAHSAGVRAPFHVEVLPGPGLDHAATAATPPRSGIN